MLVHHARWSDLDPGTHPLDLDRLRAPISAIVFEAAAAASIDRGAIVQRIDRLLLHEHGVWISGWRWAASEPGGGGPVRGWCCERDSVLRADDPGPAATVERVLAAIATWRTYLVDLATHFAALRAEAAARSREAAVERAAARLLPLVVGATGAEDAWYATFSATLGWFLDSLVGEPEADDLKSIVAGVVCGRFESWTAPDEDTAHRTCAELGTAVAGAGPAPPRDALSDWLEVRPAAFSRFRSRLPATPVAADGHERFIEEVDRRRDPHRADRLASALLLCRDSARRGLRLTLDQLAEWQGVVLGSSAPAALRTAPAHARGGREHYALLPDLQRRFEAALADAHGRDPLVVRAARVYLDVCFFHPFADGNARAARLALDHVLTTASHALHIAEPVFVVARSGSDRHGARALATLLEQIVGPRPSI